MARKYGTNLDLTKNELLNVVIQVLASAPGSPKAGQIYYDSTKKELGFYNGTEFKYTASYTLPEATETVLGGIKLAGDIKGGTGAAPQVTNLHLSGDTAVNHKFTELTIPTEAKDAANKEYVDSKVNGQAWKAPVEVATFAALPAYTQSGSGATGTLEANANGALTVDGVAVTTNMRILVRLAVEAKHNGIYRAAQAGGASEKYKLIRAEDGTTGAQLKDATVLVHAGTELSDRVYNISNTTEITVDTTAITIVEIQSGTAVVGDGTYTERETNKIALKPNSASPTAPGNGEVSAVTKGGTRKATFALTGNSSLTEFTVTHNLGTRLLMLQGQENSAGNPTVPIELDWEPSSTNAVLIKFPTAPASGTTFFGSIYG